MLSMLDRHQVQTLRAAGYSYRKIAATLQIALSTVQRVLREPAVTAAERQRSARRALRPRGRPPPDGRPAAPHADGMAPDRAAAHGPRSPAAAARGGEAL